MDDITMRSVSRRGFLGGAAAAAAFLGLGLDTRAAFAQPAVADIKLGLVVKALDHPFFIAVNAGAERMAAELGCKLQTVATSTQADASGQITLIEDLISKKTNAIMVTPNDSKAIIPGIDAARAAGLPVIIVDTPADGGDFQCFVGTANYGACVRAAQWLGKKLNGKGKIAILEGIPGISITRERVGGFTETIKANFPDIQIVASLPANYEMEQGMKATEDILTKNKELDAIFATSDAMGQGAVRAVEAADRKDKVFIMSYDGQPQAFELIKDGRLDAEAAQKPVLMGELSVYLAVRAVLGKQIPVSVDGGTTVVTKDDVMNWIKQNDKGEWVLS